MMKQTDSLLWEVLSCEQEMFEKAQFCSGAPASPGAADRFLRLRAAWLSVWNSDMLECYLQDLCSAQAEGRNLICEQRAWRLVLQAPAQYRQLRDKLPLPSLEKEWLIDWLCAACAEWKTNLDRLYPEDAPLVQTLFRENDADKDLSPELILRGEMMTLSVKTLRQYAAHVERLQNMNQNLLKLAVIHLLNPRRIARNREASPFPRNSRTLSL